ncbi:MAG: hypothetical protein KDA84_13465, partial [Planctomycetaceae bacterium]|nr:hypothetical protein [Planctomycetaceae bacterium]
SLLIFRGGTEPSGLAGWKRFTRLVSTMLGRNAPLILVGVLSYRRPDYLQQTLEAFLARNATLLDGTIQLIGLDQAATESTRQVFDQFRESFEAVYFTPENHGIGWGYSQLVRCAANHGAEFYLHLEDDWLCRESLADYLSPLLELFRQSDVGTIRLRTIADPIDGMNHVTQEPLTFVDWDANFEVGDFHYVFNPHLVRLKVSQKLIPCVSEHDAQIRYHKLGLRAARLKAHVFEHGGHRRAAGRISRRESSPALLSLDELREQVPRF